MCDYFVAILTDKRSIVYGNEYVESIIVFRSEYHIKVFRSNGSSLILSSYGVPYTNPQAMIRPHSLQKSMKKCPESGMISRLLDMFERGKKS